MIKETNNINEIQYVLDNLRQEDEQELIALLGSEWKEKTLLNLKNIKVKILFALDDEGVQRPVAMGNFTEVIEQDSKIACVWLLSTPLISKNKKLFFEELKSQIQAAEQKYEIMYNFIYKSNHKAKGWLKHFGFKFDNPKPQGINVKKDFEFFYRRTERNNK